MAASAVLGVGLYASACDSGSPTGPADDVLGPGGGTVGIPGVVLSVPAGSLPPGTRITVDPVRPGDLASDLQVDPDSIVPGTLFDFGPDGLTFDPPARISLSYDPTLLPVGTNESLLRVIRIDTAVSYVAGSRVDTLNNRISAPVEHFTLFGVALPELFPASRDVSISEIITVTDEVPIEDAPPISLSISETVTITDSVPLESEPPISLTIEETVNVTDSVVPPVSGVVRIDVTEAIGVTDAATAVPDQDVVRIDVSEAIGVVDAPSTDAAGIVRIDVAEAIGVVDAPSTDAAGIVRIDVAEAIGVVDVPAPEVQGVVRIDVTEAIGVADAVSSDTPGLVRIDVDEAVGVADVVATDVQTPPAAYVYALSGAGSVLVVDLNTRSVVTSLAVPTSAERIVRRPGTTELWVSEGPTGGVTVIDATTNTITDQFASGAGYSSEIVFDPTGATALISDLTIRTGPVAVDAATRASAGTTPTLENGRVRGVAISPDRTKGWLSAGDFFARYDVATGTIEASVTGVAPNEILLRPGGSDLWEYAEPDGWMLVRDTAALLATDTLATPFPRLNTAFEGGHVFTAAGDRVWATTDDSRLVALDAGSGNAVVDHTLASAAGRLTLDEVEGQAWTVARDIDELLLVDLATGVILTRFTLTDPTDVAIYR